jgi:hypothetical protein
MSFLENERARQVSQRDQLFDDPGGGLFRQIPRPFVLANPLKNLFEPIRMDALDYFRRNQIAWWNDHAKGPTGHLLSSQIACLNHLFYLRDKQPLASVVLNCISNEFIQAEMVDDGYVEFEVVGQRNYLGEKSHHRGANATSIDALMIGRKMDGRKCLVMIEWKYTEKYVGEDKYIPARAKIYDRLIMDPESPLRVKDPQFIYFDPYDQLMRQTLLGWRMTISREYGCGEYLHVHVIPQVNRELRLTNTSPSLVGSSMSEAWKSVLKQPELYMVVTPESLFDVVKHLDSARSLAAYLSARYWQPQ